MKKIRFLLWAIFCLVSSFLYGQSDNTDLDFPEERRNRAESTVEGMTQAHKYKLGILRIRPEFSMNSGYDSNALLRDEQEIGDYFITAIPGASVGTRLGRAAFLRLIEEVSFVYYKKLDQRRDIFNATRGELLTGTSRMLVTFDGGYLKRKSPLDDELDVPVDQERSDAGVGIEYTLTRKLDLRSSYRYVRTELEFDEEINDLQINLRDTRATFIGVGLDHHLKQTIALATDFTVGRSEDIESERVTTFWSALGGVEFSARRLIGRAQFGYGSSDSQEENARDSFLIDLGLDFILGRRTQVGVFVNRRYQFSVFLNDGLRLTTLGGVRASVPISNRVGISGSFSVGKHDYDDQLIDGVIITKDNFRKADLGFDIRIVHNLILRMGGTYIKRDTDIPGLDKEQLTYGLGIGYTLNVN
jgi:hypothetical protein